MLLCATEPDFMRKVELAGHPDACLISDNELFRIKKRRQRRKKHKTVAWKSDHHKHRTYEYGFCEMLRKTLTQSYVRRCIGAGGPSKSGCPDVLLADPPAEIQTKIVSWPGYRLSQPQFFTWIRTCHCVAATRVQPE
ncbi:hypothetical protein D3C80_1671770 [compost metagenome]